MNAALCHDICGCLLPLFPEGFLEHDFLGLVQILGPAALYPAGDTRCNLHTGTQAVDTSCPSCTSVASRLRYSFLPCAQVKLSASGSYSYIFNSSHLFAKLARFLLVVVGGLYEAHLAILLQIQIVLQTFIARVLPPLPHSAPGATGTAHSAWDAVFSHLYGSRIPPDQ